MREIEKMGGWMKVPSSWMPQSVRWRGLNYPQVDDNQSIGTFSIITWTLPIDIYRQYPNVRRPKVSKLF